MHVGHLFGSFAPGGAEMGAVRLMRACPDPAVRHTVVCIGSDTRLARETGVPCVSLGLDGRQWAASLALAGLCRRLGLTVLHVNNLAPWPDGVLAGRMSGCRVIQTFHGVETSRLRFPLAKRLLFQAAARASHGVVAVAHAAAGLLAGLTGIAPGRIQVIPNGVDTEVFRPAETDKAALRKALGLPPQAVTGLLLGCVAALRPVKDHAGLLRALARAVAANPDAAMTLALVGDGPEEARLRQLAGELGLGERVLFLGRRVDVPELLRAMDAFVLNSETEGLSYAVLEAMASGLPVVASAVGGNVSLVEPGRGGWLYPAGDEGRLAEMLALAQARAGELAAMGRAARDVVMNGYSLAAMAQAYQRLYDGAA